MDRHNRSVCRKLRALVVTVFFSSTLQAWTASYAAEEGKSASVQAESLFARGRQLMRSGRFVEACDAFAASQQLDPAIGTLMNLAECNERIGRTATAWSQFRDVASLAARVGSDPRAAIAQKRATALETRLCHVKIVTSELPSGVAFTIKLDGIVVPMPAWNTHLPVDPGPHEVQATAEGFDAWSLTTQVVDADEVSVVVQPPHRLAKPDPVTTEPHVPVTAATPAIATPPPTPSVVTPSNTGVWIGATVTAAALAVGTVTGIMAINKWGRVSIGCRTEGTCTSQERNDGDSARVTGNVSTISFVAAGTAAAVTGWLWWRSRPVTSAWLDDRSVGVAIAGRF